METADDASRPSGIRSEIGEEEIQNQPQTRTRSAAVGGSSAENTRRAKDTVQTSAADAEQTWADTQAKLGRTSNNASLMKRNVQQVRLRPSTNRLPATMNQPNQSNQGRASSNTTPEAEIREVISQLNKAHGEELRVLTKQLKRMLDEQERRHRTDIDGIRSDFDYFRDN